MTTVEFFAVLGLFQKPFPRSKNLYFAGTVDPRSSMVTFFTLIAQGNGEAELGANTIAVRPDMADDRAKGMSFSRMTSR